MSQKSSGKDDRIYAVVDKTTLEEVDRIAAKYGATRQEVLIELFRMDLTERPEGSALH